METKINIAEILKDKPEGTKLWTDMFGSVTLYVVTVVSDAFQVKHHNKEPWFDKDGKLYKEGVLCIYPSKSMRDWEKFTWKKNDVLVNSSGFKIFFDRWANDDYTRFFGKVNLLENSFSYETEKYTLASKDENLDTLEIEKPEFKDGDIVVTDAVPSLCYSKCIFILKGDLNTGESCANSYIFYNINNNDFCFDVLDTKIRDRNIRLATEEEKKQLFSALEKKGKAWDAKKKMIVVLKSLWTPKPFDRVITRNAADDVWTANIFSHMDSHGEYVTIACVGGYTQCLPYNEETAKLIGTTKDVEG